MRKYQILAILAFSTFIVSAFLLGPNVGCALEPIPEKSGFSGFVTAGPVFISGKSNLSAGSLGEKRIDSIYDKPESNSTILPGLTGEVAYTFAFTRTQLFLGNRLEDSLRGDFALQAGVRQELPDKSIISAGYMFSPLASEVWEDPYVAGQRREETDRRASGVRLTYDKILGSNLQVEFTWRGIRIEDELSGRTYLGLPEPQARLLDRDGDSYRLGVVYLFKIGENQFLAPNVEYGQENLDGDAMSNDRMLFSLTHTYRVKRWRFVTNLFYAHADYDERNPIYNRTRKDNNYGGSITVFYGPIFDVQGLNLSGAVFALHENANINFYKQTFTGGMLSIFYRF